MSPGETLQPPGPQSGMQSQDGDGGPGRWGRVCVRAERGCQQAPSSQYRRSAETPGGLARVEEESKDLEDPQDPEGQL